jgi:hypothetical protein
MSENKQRITRVSGDEARLLKGETGYARLDAMTDDDIARAVADDPDALPRDVDWTDALLVIPPGKDIITLRLDRDLLDYSRQGQRLPDPDQSDSARLVRSGAKTGKDHRPRSRQAGARPSGGPQSRGCGSCRIQKTRGEKGRPQARNPSEKARMKQRDSIAIGAAVLALQAAFLIALHFILR